MNQQRGMTLLELLVATGILAFVSGLALVGIQQMVSNTAQLSTHEQFTNQTYLTHYLLQQDVQMAWSNPGSSRQVAFTADSASMSMVRPMPALASSTHVVASRQRTPVGLQQVRWTVRNDALIRSTRTVGAQNGWAERVMMPVKSFYCEYQNGVGQIVNRWPNQAIESPRLPKQVRCTVRDESNAESLLVLTPWEQV